MKRFDTVAKLKLAKLKEGQFVETGGYYVKGDAGAARYLIVTPQAFDGYGDHELANGNVAVLQVNDTVDAASWGITYDTNDSSTALKSLLESRVETVVFSAECSLSLVASATLTTSKTLIGDGGIKWVGGAASGLMVTVECSGFDFSYDIQTNGDNLISAGWLIENSDTMSATLPKCTFKGKTKNFKATAATAFNSNAYIRGSFERVEASGGSHANTSRNAGLGAATQTIVVDYKTSPLRYPRTIKHFNNTYSGIASADVGAADGDTDYFVCTMPTPVNFPNGDGTNGYPDIDVESYGNTYLNPIGRSEKFQCVPNTHDNTVVRDGDKGSRTMNGVSIDFNLQWGVGECRNQTIQLKGSSTSAITTDYAPVSYFQGTDYGERRGAVSCSDITVYNQINSALADNVHYLVGLQTNSTSATKPLGLVDLKNITVIGGTADHAVIISYGAGGVGSINLDNIEADFNYNPIAIQTACTDIRLIAKNITNLNATERLLVNDVGGGNRAFTGDAFGFNYVGITQTYEYGATFGSAPSLAGAALSDPSPNQNSGGSLSVQSKFVADDATHTFDVRGFTKGNHMITVVVSFGTHAAMGSFACQGASAAIIAKSANSPSLIVTGAGSNPDTAGYFNMWVDANGALNVKNRLGSSRAVTISFLG